MSKSESAGGDVRYLGAKWLVEVVAATWAKGGNTKSVKRWTSLMKREIGRRIRPDHEAWASGVRGRTEYLVDLCVCEPSRRWRDYRGLDLAVEIEWGGTLEQAWEDFVKVMDLRASSRLFVTSLNKQAWRSRGRGFVQGAKAVVDKHKHGTAGDWVLVVLSEKHGQGVDYLLLRRGKKIESLTPTG